VVLRAFLGGLAGLVGYVCFWKVTTVLRKIIPGAFIAIVFGGCCFVQECRLIEPIEVNFAVA
jgi:hypothetical protein